jgi:S1-C subfamily serine protease
MGSPFGLESTVSAGIVSAINRSMRGVGGRLIEGVVQHTAPINPGNSGGPLLDGRAMVVGVNAATIAFAQGVGFAVPASTVRWVVGELIAHGQVKRPKLGIAAQMVAIPRKIVRALDLFNEHGVLVSGVEDKSAAARAGILEGDIIVEFEGRVVGGIDDLHRLLGRAKGEVTLAVVRDEALRRVVLRV